MIENKMGFCNDESCNVIVTKEQCLEEEIKKDNIVTNKNENYI